MHDLSYTALYTLEIPVHLMGVRSVATLINQHCWNNDSSRLEFIDAEGTVRHAEVIVTNRDIHDWNTWSGNRLD